MAAMIVMTGNIMKTSFSCPLRICSPGDFFFYEGFCICTIFSFELRNARMVGCIQADSDGHEKCAGNDQWNNEGFGGRRPAPETES